MKTIILLDKFFQEMFCYFAIIHIIKLLSISYIYGKNQFAVCWVVEEEAHRPQSEIDCAE